MLSNVGFSTEQSRLQTYKSLGFKLPSMFLTNCFDIRLALRILLHLASLCKGGGHGICGKRNVGKRPTACLRQNQTLHMTSKSHLTVVLSLCLDMDKTWGHLELVIVFLGGQRAFKIKDGAILEMKQKG